MRHSLIFLVLLPFVVFAQQYRYINGLKFPSNGDDPANKHIAIQFLNPQNDGLPIWGADHGGTTWVWEYYPFQQTGYYVTFFWADNGDNWHEAYYGCHPFPIPPSAGSGTSHYWELAGMANGRDNTKTRSGEPLVVVKERWYKQALRIHVNPDGSKQGVFYIDLPDTSNQFVIDVTSDAGWGETNPPNPVVVFGSAPWAKSERLSGILGRIKIFNKEIPGRDILKEAEDMNSLNTPAGQENIWWGVTSFDDIDDLKGDYGTGRAFEWADIYKATVVKIDSIELNPDNKSPRFTGALPKISFNEDDSLSYAVSNWYPYVEDPDNSDLELSFVLNGGENVRYHYVDKSYKFSAAKDWFGSETLQLIVSDGSLSDTASLLIEVESVNDSPLIIGLPDTLHFRSDSSVLLQMNEYAYDVDSPHSLLSWSFAVSNDSLLYSYNAGKQELRIWAPGFIGVERLFCTLMDEQNARADDSVAVYIEPATAIKAISNPAIPGNFQLEQNYPNPFNPITTIKYGLPHRAKVRLILFTLLGKKIADLVDDIKPAGFHLLHFDASAYPSGIYFYRLHVENFVQAKKMIIIK